MSSNPSSTAGLPSDLMANVAQLVQQAVSQAMASASVTSPSTTNATMGPPPIQPPPPPPPSTQPPPSAQPSLSMNTSLVPTPQSVGADGSVLSALTGPSTIPLSSAGPITPYRSISAGSTISSPGVPGLRALASQGSSASTPRLTAILRQRINDANQERLEHSAAGRGHDGRGSTSLSSRRGNSTTAPRRSRGPAARRPTLRDCLPRKQLPSVDDVIVACADPTSQQQVVAANITVHVLFSFIEGSDNATFGMTKHSILYTDTDAHEACLRQCDLVFEHQDPVALETTVDQILTDAQVRMEELGWSFQQRAGTLSLRSSRAPLSLVGLVNHGVHIAAPPPHELCRIKLRPEPPSTTLGQLIQNPYFMSPRKPELSIAGNRFIIRLMSTLPIGRRVSLKNLRLSEDDDEVRLHWCLSIRVKLALTDSAAYPELDHMICEHCECERGSSANRVRPRLPCASTPARPASMRTRTPSGQIGTESIDSEAESTEVARSLIVDHQTIDFPSSLSELWECPASSSLDRDFDIPPFTLHQLPEAALDVVRHYHRRAGLGDPARLCLRARDLQDMHHMLDVEIEKAMRQQDYSHLLSPSRVFTINVSVGIGVERELVYTALLRYAQENFNTLFAPSFIEPYVDLIATPPGPASQFISGERLERYEKLGALVGLNLLHGIIPSAPIAFSPFLLQLCLNSGDVRSLDEDLVMALAAELALTLRSWAEGDEHSDVSSFRSILATIYNLTPAQLAGRSPEMHDAYPVDMLFRSASGHLLDSKEVTAFRKGLDMPCPGGLTLPKILRSFRGGTSAYLLAAHGSIIHSPRDLRSKIFVEVEAGVDLDALGIALGHTDRTFDANMFIFDFLEDTGIPCPTLMEGAKSKFPSIVAFDKQDTDAVAFRSRMFVWAATGAPSSPTLDIKVVFCKDSNPCYIPAHVTGEQRAQQIEAGFITSHTCSGDVYIPAGHLFQMVLQSYNPESEPGNLRDAIHHWLLVELISSIQQSTTL